MPAPCELPPLPLQNIDAFAEPYEDVITLLRQKTPPTRVDLTRVDRAIRAWELELALWRSDAIDLERRVSLIPRRHVLEQRIERANALITSRLELTTTLRGFLTPLPA